MPRNARARRVSAKMKTAWAEELQSAGHLVCPIQGCQQTYVTVANFQTHYKYCTGTSNLQHCQYCESLIFSGNEAILHHMEVEHPDKLQEYMGQCTTDCGRSNGCPRGAEGFSGTHQESKNGTLRAGTRSQTPMQAKGLGRSTVRKNGALSKKKVLGQTKDKCAEDTVNKNHSFIDGVSQEMHFENSADKRSKSTDSDLKSLKHKTGSFPGIHTETSCVSANGCNNSTLNGTNSNCSVDEHSHNSGSAQRISRKMSRHQKLSSHVQQQACCQQVEFSRDWTSQRKTYSRIREKNRSLNMSEGFSSLQAGIHDSYLLSVSSEESDVPFMSWEDVPNSELMINSSTKKLPDKSSSQAKQRYCDRVSVMTHHSEVNNLQSSLPVSSHLHVNYSRRESSELAHDRKHSRFCDISAKDSSSTSRSDETNVYTDTSLHCQVGVAVEKRCPVTVSDFSELTESGGDTNCESSLQNCDTNKVMLTDSAAQSHISVAGSVEKIYTRNCNNWVKQLEPDKQDMIQEPVSVKTKVPNAAVTVYFKTSYKNTDVNLTGSGFSKEPEQNVSSNRAGFNQRKLEVSADDMLKISDFYRRSGQKAGSENYFGVSGCSSRVQTLKMLSLEVVRQVLHKEQLVFASSPPKGAKATSSDNVPASSNIFITPQEGITYIRNTCGHVLKEIVDCVESNVGGFEVSASKLSASKSEKLVSLSQSSRETSSFSSFIEDPEMMATDHVNQLSREVDKNKSHIQASDSDPTNNCFNSGSCLSASDSCTVAEKHKKGRTCKKPAIPSQETIKTQKVFNALFPKFFPHNETTTADQEVSTEVSSVLENLLTVVSRRERGQPCECVIDPDQSSQHTVPYYLQNAIECSNEKQCNSPLDTTDVAKVEEPLIKDTDKKEICLDSFSRSIELPKTCVSSPIKGDCATSGSVSIAAPFGTEILDRVNSDYTSENARGTDRVAHTKHVDGQFSDIAEKVKLETAEITCSLPDTEKLSHSDSLPVEKRNSVCVEKSDRKSDSLNGVSAASIDVPLFKTECSVGMHELTDTAFVSKNEITDVTVICGGISVEGIKQGTDTSSSSIRQHEVKTENENSLVKNELSANFRNGQSSALVPVAPENAISCRTRKAIECLLESQKPHAEPSLCIAASNSSVTEIKEHLESKPEPKQERVCLNAEDNKRKICKCDETSCVLEKNCSSKMLCNPSSDKDTYHHSSLSDDIRESFPEGSAEFQRSMEQCMGAATSIIPKTEKVDFSRQPPMGVHFDISTGATFNSHTYKLRPRRTTRASLKSLHTRIADNDGQENFGSWFCIKKLNENAEKEMSVFRTVSEFIHETGKSSSEMHSRDSRPLHALTPSKAGSCVSKSEGKRRGRLRKASLKPVTDQHVSAEPAAESLSEKECSMNAGISETSPSLHPIHAENKNFPGGKLNSVLSVSSGLVKTFATRNKTEEVLIKEQILVTHVEPETLEATSGVENTAEKTIKCGNSPQISARNSKRTFSTLPRRKSPRINNSQQKDLTNKKCGKSASQAVHQNVKADVKSSQEEEILPTCTISDNSYSCAASIQVSNEIPFNDRQLKKQTRKTFGAACFVSDEVSDNSVTSVNTFTGGRKRRSRSRNLSMGELEICVKKEQMSDSSLNISFSDDTKLCIPSCDTEKPFSKNLHKRQKKAQSASFTINTERSDKFSVKHEHTLLGLSEKAVAEVSDALAACTEGITKTELQIEKCSDSQQILSALQGPSVIHEYAGVTSEHSGSSKREQGVKSREVSLKSLGGKEITVEKEITAGSLPEEHKYSENLCDAATIAHKSPLNSVVQGMKSESMLDILKKECSEATNSVVSEKQLVNAHQGEGQECDTSFSHTLQASVEPDDSLLFTKKVRKLPVLNRKQRQTRRQVKSAGVAITSKKRMPKRAKISSKKHSSPSLSHCTNTPILSSTLKKVDTVTKKVPVSTRKPRPTKRMSSTQSKMFCETKKASGRSGKKRKLSNSAQVDQNTSASKSGSKSAEIADDLNEIMSAVTVKNEDMLPQEHSKVCNEQAGSKSTSTHSLLEEPSSAESQKTKGKADETDPGGSDLELHSSTPIAARKRKSTFRGSFSLDDPVTSDLVLSVKSPVGERQISQVAEKHTKAAVHIQEGKTHEEGDIPVEDECCKARCKYKTSVGRKHKKSKLVSSPCFGDNSSPIPLKNAKGITKSPVQYDPEKHEEITDGNKTGNNETSIIDVSDAEDTSVGTDACQDINTKPDGVLMEVIGVPGKNRTVGKRHRSSRSAAVKARELLSNFMRNDRFAGTQYLQDETRAEKEDEDFTVPDGVGEPEQCSDEDTSGHIASKLLMFKDYYEVPSTARSIPETQKPSRKLVAKWMKQIASKGKAVCPRENCRKMLETKAGMIYHYEYSCLRAQRRWLCKICKKRFPPSAGALFKHMKTDHNIINRVEKATPKRSKNTSKEFPDDQDFSTEHLTRHQKDALFSEYPPRKSMWVPLGPDFLSMGCLPLLKASVFFKICDKRYKSNNSLWLSLPCFESHVANNNSHTATFFAGGPISSCAWCPTPYKVNAVQYVAIASGDSVEAFHSAVSTQGQRGLLQIWDMGHLNGDRVMSAPVLKLAVPHVYGNVFDMAWCPTGCWEDPSKADVPEEFLPRLGLLAIACADSYIRIFSIPHPSSLNLPEQMPFYSVKPVLVLIPAFERSVKHSLVSRRAVCLSMSWQKTDGCKFILGGFGNGLVSLWQVKSTPESLTVGTNEAITPCVTFQAHSTAVTGVDFAPLPGVQWCASSSHEKSLKVWDLTECVCVLERKKGSAKSLKWPSLWTGIFLSLDDGTCLCSGTAVYEELAVMRKKYMPAVFRHTSCLWSCSTSEWLKVAASAGVSGEVTAFQLSNLNTMYTKNYTENRVPVFRTEIEHLGEHEPHDSETDTSGGSSFHQEMCSSHKHLPSGKPEVLTEQQTSKPVGDSVQGACIQECAECQYCRTPSRSSFCCYNWPADCIFDLPKERCPKKYGVCHSSRSRPGKMFQRQGAGMASAVSCGVIRKDATKKFPVYFSPEQRSIIVPDSDVTREKKKARSRIYFSRFSQQPAHIQTRKCLLFNSSSSCKPSSLSVSNSAHPPEIYDVVDDLLKKCEEMVPGKSLFHAKSFKCPNSSANNGTHEASHNSCISLTSSAQKDVPRESWIPHESACANACESSVNWSDKLYSFSSSAHLQMSATEKQCSISHCTAKCCGLVFIDHDLVNPRKIPKQEFSRIKLESTSVIDNNLRCPIAAINCLSWNPNRGSPHWLLTGGHCGIARLICAKGLEP